MKLPKINYRSKTFVIVTFLTLAITVGVLFRLLTPPPQPAFTYQDIRPGITTSQELIQKMGNPLSQETQGDKTTYKFTSDYVQDPHVAVTQNDKTVLLIQKEKLNQGPKIKDLIPQLDQPKATLYADYLGPFYPVYVFPDKGIALGTHETSGVVIEIWYFQPMSLQQFQTLSPYPLSATPPKLD